MATPQLGTISTTGTGYAMGYDPLAARQIAQVAADPLATPAPTASPAGTSVQLWPDFLEDKSKEAGFDDSTTVDPKVKSAWYRAYHSNYIPSVVGDPQLAKRMANQSMATYTNPTAEAVNEAARQKDALAAMKEKPVISGRDPSTVAVPTGMGSSTGKEYQESAIGVEEGVGSMLRRATTKAVGGVVSGVGSVVDLAEIAAKGIWNTIADDDNQLTAEDRSGLAKTVSDALHNAGAAISDSQKTEFSKKFNEAFATDKAEAFNMLFSGDGADYLFTEFVPDMVGVMGGSGGVGALAVKGAQKVAGKVAGNTAEKAAAAALLGGSEVAIAGNALEKFATSKTAVMKGAMAAMAFGSGGNTGRETEKMVNAQFGAMSLDEFANLPEMADEKSKFQQLSPDKQETFKADYARQHALEVAGFASLAGSVLTAAAIKLSPSSEHLVATMLGGSAAGAIPATTLKTIVSQGAKEAAFNALDEGGQVVIQDTGAIYAGSGEKIRWGDVGGAALLGALGGALTSASLNSANYVGEHGYGWYSNNSFDTETGSKLSPWSTAKKLADRVTSKAKFRPTAQAANAASDNTVEAEDFDGANHNPVDLAPTEVYDPEADKRYSVDAAINNALRDYADGTTVQDTLKGIKASVAANFKDIANVPPELVQQAHDTARAFVVKKLLNDARLSEARVPTDIKGKDRTAALKSSHTVLSQVLDMNNHPEGFNGVISDIARVGDILIAEGKLQDVEATVEHFTDLLDHPVTREGIRVALKARNYDGFAGIPLRLGKDTTVDDVVAVANQLLHHLKGTKPPAKETPVDALPATERDNQWAAMETASREYVAQQVAGANALADTPTPYEQTRPGLYAAVLGAVETANKARAIQDIRDNGVGADAAGVVPALNKASRALADEFMRTLDNGYITPSAETDVQEMPPNEQTQQWASMEGAAKKFITEAIKHTSALDSKKQAPYTDLRPGLRNAVLAAAETQLKARAISNVNTSGLGTDVGAIIPAMIAQSTALADDFMLSIDAAYTPHSANVTEAPAKVDMPAKPPKAAKPEPAPYSLADITAPKVKAPADTLATPASDTLAMPVTPAAPLAAPLAAPITPASIPTQSTSAAALEASTNNLRVTKPEDYKLGKGVLYDKFSQYLSENLKNGSISVDNAIAAFTGSKEARDLAHGPTYDALLAAARYNKPLVPIVKARMAVLTKSKNAVAKVSPEVSVLAAMLYMMSTPEARATLPYAMNPAASGDANLFAEGSPVGMNAHDALTVADRIFRTDNLDGFANLHIVASDKEVPGNRKGDPVVAKLIDHGDGTFSIVINAARVASERDIELAIAHEVGHIGLRRAGHDIDALIRRAVADLGGVKGVTRAAKRAGMREVSRYTDGKNDVDAAATLIDEMVAYAFERGLGGNIFGRAYLHLLDMYNSFRGVLQNMGMVHLPSMGDAAIARLVLEARKGITGKKPVARTGMLHGSPAYKFSDHAAARGIGVPLNVKVASLADLGPFRSLGNKLYAAWRGYARTPDGDLVYNDQRDYTRQLADSGIALADRVDALRQEYGIDPKTGQPLESAGYAAFKAEIQEKYDHFLAESTNPNNRRGDRTKAEKHVAALKKVLDKKQPVFRDNMDFYGATALARGIVGAVRRKDTKDIVEPFFDEMQAALKEALDADPSLPENQRTRKISEIRKQIDLYLHAQHAAERDIAGVVLKHPLSAEKGAARKQIIEEFLNFSYHRVLDPDAHDPQVEAVRDAAWAKLLRLVPQKALAESVQMGKWSGMNAKRQLAVLNSFKEGGDNAGYQKVLDVALKYRQRFVDRTVTNNNRSGKYRSNTTDDINAPTEQMYGTITKNFATMVDLMGYKNYVPLKGSGAKGVSLDNGETIYSYLAPESAFHLMEGHGDGDKEFSVIQTLDKDLEASAVRIGHKEVTTALLNYAKDFGSLHGMEVIDRGKAFKLNAIGIEEVISNHKPNTVPHIVNGHRFDIVMDTNAADPITAMQNKQTMQALADFWTPPRSDINIPGFRAFTRQLSVFNTILNPFYLKSALIREPLGMIDLIRYDQRIGGTGLGQAKSAKLLADIYKNFNLADKQSLMRHFMKAERPDYRTQVFPDPLLRAASEYVALGGETGIQQGIGSDIVSRHSALDIVDKLKPVSLLGKIGEGVNAAADTMGNIYTAMDLTARTVIFHELVKNHHWEPKKAAAYTKQLMDFDQTGIQTHNMSMFYAFFKSGALGAQSFMKRLHRPDGSLNKALVLYHVSMGATLYALANLWHGDDDDGIPVMRKLSTTSAMKHIPLPFSDEFGSPYTLQRGYGPGQALASIGVAAARVALGHSSLGESISSSAMTIKDSIQPFGLPQDVNAPNSGGSLAGAAVGIVPTLLRPLMEIAANKDSFGSDISSEFGGEGGKTAPLYQQGRYSTGEPWQDLAEIMAEAGVLNTTPETYRHLAKAYTGGVGRVVGDILTGATELLSGEVYPASPFDKKVMDLFTWRLKDAAFFDDEQWGQMQTAVKEVANFAEAGAQLSADDQRLADLEPVVKSVNSATSKLQKAAKQAHLDGDFIQEAALRDEIDALKIEAVKQWFEMR